MSASDSFHTLLQKIAPLPAQRQKVEKHRDSIATRLKAEFSFYEMRTIGSFERGTDVKDQSDVDLFAVFKRDEVKWGDDYKSSTRMLEKVRGALIDRYPNTEIFTDTHAIVVQFSSGVSVDVVPSYYWRHSRDKKYPFYKMPDGSGGWMEVCPDAHHTFISQANDQSRSKLVGTARLMKFWRACRKEPLPISSFHIEMLLAEHQICAGAKSYAVCFVELLDLMVARQCAALQDPIKIEGLISAVKVPSLKTRTLNSIRKAAEHANLALLNDVRGSIPEARRQWDIVFNGNFP